MALGARAALGWLLVGACASDGAETTATTTTTLDAVSECDEAIASIGDATERYVAGYETSVLSSTPVDEAAPTTTPGPEPLDEGGYQDALEEAQQRIESLACEPRRTQVELARRLYAVETESPVADAVLRQLVATMTDPSAGQATDAAVAPDDDLRDAVARAGDGSTLRLAAGEYRLDDPLVLLNGVHLVGTGAGQTTIVSTAGDAVIVALTDKTIRVEGLTIRHEGDRPSSIVLGGPAASIALSDSHLSGAVADDNGQGGAGVLMFAPDRDAAGRGTTLEITDVELSDNEAAGVVLSGGHRASIVRASIQRSGQCGLCFFDTSDGSVEASTFDDNAVGISMAGTARPSVLGTTIRGGDVGLQVGGDAVPALRDVTFVAQARAAAIFSDSATGSLDDVRCEEVDFGLVIGRDALPSIGETDCEVVRSDE